MTTTLDTPTTARPDLSLARLHAMRGGYLLMGVGLALVKWPKLRGAHNLPVYEGVTLCLDGGLHAGFSTVAVNCSLDVVIIAVIPWRYAWTAFARTPGDRWRGPR